MHGKSCGTSNHKLVCLQETRPSKLIRWVRVSDHNGGVYAFFPAGNDTSQH
jgi:hypothetical protein